ncbi:BspA family leucine-rich repeat surface protein [Mycoplasmopsis bovis]|uniref:BspA family leucine-rich repeat surface protein n=1 Tax=Mycoplasmopsis bovis TaxID=28903 RepID=A0A2N8U1M0_MYCBV|nr:BspA family leucine-rich repeat surface protein [Mycoplasmopsis bovis]MBT1315261.1 BspA family leucine-rich repeat surface protein [Mycoplasmopsis bovis]MBT1318938.1 BspA family leucine-rich repeat surface protein [Mycoplasmopsis bovis]MBT1320408.1 BspA family leucine-rich repeat surface protein [Mycoplasmopsis bovis]MBT1324136.1 BspA family leucine-rich repeat surface protein [Mycoplasmopsis bovis]MBT1327080.1 BspA family leucine-rich repeat surface protein [Mycoplasmopsis bovis]
MNKKKLILIRGGVLFASSLPLIAASCKNNETKEPEKEPEMDAPIAPPTDPEKDNPGKTEPMHSDKPKVLKTDISSLKLEFTPTNSTNKNDVLELLKRQPKLDNLTESDFDFKLEKKSLLNREGLIVIAANPESQLVSGMLNITINKLDKLIPREHKYNNDKTKVLEIGYDEKGRIKKFAQNVKEVPANLPEEIISLDWAFARNLNEKIVNLEKWDTSNIESMSKTFLQAKKFNTDISSWKTNSVKDMSNMFTSAEAFSQNLDKWDTSNVTTMNRMFQEAKAFNGDISTWDTKNVSDMAYMFSGATTFNKDISGWNVDNVSTMERMFENASKFNSPIFKLVSPKVKNMQYMFYNAKEFNNSNISDWNTSSVTDIRSMFRGATKFNQNLNWKTEKITNMSSLFTEAISFNGDITKWNTGNVVDMSEMFWGAQTFNQDIGNWNVRNVKDVTSMFFQARNFDKSLKNWKFNTEPKHNHFKNGSKLKDLPTFR